MIRASSSRKAGPQSPSFGGSSVFARLMHLPRFGVGPTRALASGTGVKVGIAESAVALADAAIASIAIATPQLVRALKAAIPAPVLSFAIPRLHRRTVQPSALRIALFSGNYN